MVVVSLSSNFCNLDRSQRRFWRKRHHMGSGMNVKVAGKFRVMQHCTPILVFGHCALMTFCIANFTKKLKEMFYFAESLFICFAFLTLNLLRCEHEMTAESPKMFCREPQMRWRLHTTYFWEPYGYNSGVFRKREKCFTALCAVVR